MRTTGQVHAPEKIQKKIEVVESKKITGRSFLESVVGLNHLNSVSLGDIVFVYSVADTTMHQTTVNNLIQQALGLNTYNTGWDAVSVANGWTQNSGTQPTAFSASRSRRDGRPSWCAR